MNSTTAASEYAKSLRGQTFAISGETLEHVLWNIVGIYSVIASSAGTHPSEKSTILSRTSQTLGMLKRAGVPVPKHFFPKRVASTWVEPDGDVLQIHKSITKRFAAIDHVIGVVKNGTASFRKRDLGWEIESEGFVAKLVGQGSSIRLIYDPNSSSEDGVIIVHSEPRQLYNHLHELRELLERRFRSEKAG